LPNPEDCHRDGYLRLSGGPSKQLPTNQRSPDWRSVPKSLALPIELTALTGLSLVCALARAGREQQYPQGESNPRYQRERLAC
jgi:hypothetical protein